MSNRITRILVALFSIPLLLLVTYLGGLYFLAFVLGIGLISFFEFSMMAENKGIHLSGFIGYIFVGVIILNSYFNFVKVDLLLFAVALLLFVLELFRNNGSAINNISTTLLALLYTGLFPSSLIELRELFSNSRLIYANGGYLIIAIFITIWMTDSAAYFIGTAIGEHKLFPRVSPKKSWEGAIAGFLFAIVTIVVLKFFILSFFSWWDVISFGLIIGVFGQIGDLVESLLKRDSGVKDSSNIIPGHGGIMDRFDSLLFTAPIILLYLRLF